MLILLFSMSLFFKRRRRCAKCRSFFHQYNLELSEPSLPADVIPLSSLMNYRLLFNYCLSSICSTLSSGMSIIFMMSFQHLQSLYCPSVFQSPCNLSLISEAELGRKCDYLSSNWLIEKSYCMPLLCAYLCMCLCLYVSLNVCSFKNISSILLFYFNFYSHGFRCQNSRRICFESCKFLPYSFWPSGRYNNIPHYNSERDISHLNLNNLWPCNFKR